MSIESEELLHNELRELRSENKRLSERERNKTVQLCYDDGQNPFAREALKIVDVGVSDNIYVVESALVKTLIDALNKIAKHDTHNLHGTKGNAYLMAEIAAEAITSTQS